MSGEQGGKRGNVNSRKRLGPVEAAPWSRWRTSSRPARAVRWIETYCTLPKGHGAGRPVKLARFQRDWLEEVLDESVRSAAMQLPRGNGKSTLLAAFGLWSLFDPDEGGAPQVPIVATTIGQAIRSVYGVARAMRDAHPDLADRSLVYSAIGAQRIEIAGGGELFPVSADPDGLQGLDPSVAVVDELGFVPVESWDSLLLASGKRPRSLVVGIGTPGFDHDSALWHLRERVRSGETLPGFRWTEYAADDNCDLKDRAQWEQANPALSERFMDADALEMAVALSPEAHFRIFRLGQWVDGAECWLGADGRAVWRALEDPWVMEFDAPTWVGVDVALKHDTSAVAWCQQRPDGRWHVDARIWQPRADGRLDVSDVMQQIRELDDLYDVREVAYDARFFDLPAQQLADEGFPMVEVPQSLEVMTPAVGNAFEMIRRGEISHDGDTALEAQVLNAIPRFNERGFTISKSRSRAKIDAAVAMVIALSRSLAPAPPVLDIASNVW